MTRTSKIRRLPPELREQLHSMLDAGVPLEEITAHLNALGADVSRSGLGPLQATGGQGGGAHA